MVTDQARRQDSVTGGTEITFGGAREVFIFVNSKRAREVFSSVGQTKKVKTQKKRSSVSLQIFSQILVVVSKFLRFSTNS